MVIVLSCKNSYNMYQILVLFLMDLNYCRILNLSIEKLNLSNNLYTLKPNQFRKYPIPYFYLKLKKKLIIKYVLKNECFFDPESFEEITQVQLLSSQKYFIRQLLSNFKENYFQSNKSRPILVIIKNILCKGSCGLVKLLTIIFNSNTFKLYLDSINKKIDFEIIISLIKYSIGEINKTTIISLYAPNFANNVGKILSKFMIISKLGENFIMNFFFLVHITMDIYKTEFKKLVFFKLFSKDNSFKQYVQKYRILCKALIHLSELYYIKKYQRVFSNLNSKVISKYWSTNPLHCLLLIDEIKIIISTMLEKINRYSFSYKKGSVFTCLPNPYHYKPLGYEIISKKLLKILNKYFIDQFSWFLLDDTLSICTIKRIRFKGFSKVLKLISLKSTNNFKMTRIYLNVDFDKKNFIENICNNIINTLHCCQVILLDFTQCHTLKSYLEINKIANYFHFIKKVIKNYKYFKKNTKLVLIYKQGFNLKIIKKEIDLESLLVINYYKFQKYFKKYYSIKMLINDFLDIYLYTIKMHQIILKLDLIPNFEDIITKYQVKLFFFELKKRTKITPLTAIPIFLNLKVYKLYTLEVLMRNYLFD